MYAYSAILRCVGPELEESMNGECEGMLFFFQINTLS